jgi:hypothetical protein
MYRVRALPEAGSHLAPTSRTALLLVMPSTYLWQESQSYAGTQRTGVPRNGMPAAECFRAHGMMKSQFVQKTCTKKF